LKIAPKRFDALYGAARAAETSGDPSAANRYFRELIQISVGEERPELITAWKKVAITAGK
jgi:hypothetical protein